MVGSGNLDQARLGDTLAEILSYIRRDFATNSTAHHQGRRGDRLEKVAVVVAGDSLDESHQGVGASRAAHLGEPLLQAMGLVFPTSRNTVAGSRRRSVIASIPPSRAVRTN